MGDNAQPQQMQGVIDRKNQLGNDVADLEKQLDKLAQETRRDQQDASRKLQDGANSIRENRLKEKIRYSTDVVRSRSQEYARAVEQQITNDFEDLQRRLGDPGSSVGQNPQQQLQGALDRARELSRSLESLNERTRESGFQQGQQQNQQGQNQRDSLRTGQRNAQGQQQGQQGGQQGQQQGQPRQRGLQQGQQGQGQQQGQQAGQQQGQQQGQQGGQQQGQQAGQQGGQQGQQGQRGLNQGQQGGQQQGQQGGQQQGGGQPGERNQGNRGGNWGPNGGPEDARNYGGAWNGGRVDPGNYRRNLTPEEWRQMRSELRERLAEAEALRNELRRQGVNVDSLGGVISALQNLERGSAMDRASVEQLQQQILTSLKDFEFGLRRKLEGVDQEKVLLGTDQVPPAYRKLVEDYYRSLSSGKKKN
jgi:hypothetical protein